MSRDENRIPSPEPPRTTAALSDSSPTADDSSAARWQAVEWILLVVFLGLVGNWLLVPQNAPHQPDFHHYFFPAGNHLARGLSPYDFEVKNDDSGFVYPPHLALILVPFCLGTPDFGAILWELFNLGLLAATIGLSEMFAGLNLGWRRRIIVFLGLLLWVPIYDHFYLGSCTMIVAASVAGALVALQRRWIWLAGILLAVSAVKPHLVVVLGAGLVLREWRANKSVKLFFAGMGSVLASLVLTYAAAPSWPASLLAHQHDAYDYWGATTSLRTLLATPYGPSWWTEVLFWSTCLGANGWLLYRWADPNSNLVLLSAQTLALTILVAPYAHNYDYVLLILPILLALQRIGAETPWRRCGWFAGLVIFAVISASFQRWFHSWLEYGTVWTTLAKWFGEDAVSQAWQDSRWKYRFTGMLTPLLLTVVMFRWPPRVAPR